MKGYDLVDSVLIINRDLTELDLFVKDFLSIIEKHSDYLIVSGFVSISTGRTRATEDIDILIPVMNKKKFEILFNDLIEGGFWCYQGDFVENIYSYVKEMQNIRFAKKEQMFPNMEMIFIDKSKKAKYYEFNNPQKVKINDFEFKIPPLEFEILYKEKILTGIKDIEDAKHLRNMFKEILSEEKFKKCQIVIGEELENLKMK